MAGGIPLDWLVDISSTGVKDVFSLSKLPSLLITKYDSNLPKPKFERFYNANSVLNAYGASSSVYKFASNYFLFTSKTATKADLLTVYNWNETATPATLQGASLSNSVSDLAGLNGSFKITFGGVSEDFTIDFSGSASYADIATAMQTAIRNAVSATTAWTGAVVSYNNQTKGFFIQSGETGASSTIGYMEAPTSGTDISGEFGLSMNEGAIYWNGADAVTTIAGALSEIETENGAYYNITTDFELANELTDLATIGAWTAGSKCRYLFTYVMNKMAVLTNPSYLSSLAGYDGLNIEYRVSENQDGYSAGIVSAINFSRTNGNYNIAFNAGSIFDDYAITDQKELENLESNLANSYLKFGKLGQFQTWYGLGNINGTLTNSLNVYVANSFLVFSEQFAIANMFNSQPMVGLRGTNNNALIKSYLEGVFIGAVNSAIIVQGAELTTTEKNALLTAFGEDGETAISQCSKNGYFYKVDGVDLVNKTIQIVQAYVANTPVKRIYIANYILGA